MGAGLAKAAAARFARLPGNEYKALIHMCLTVLDKPNNKQSKLWPDGHPAALWYANWEDLALAIGREIPEETTPRHHLRREVRTLCRALETAGAIEARPHPTNAAMKAYHLALNPTEAWGETTHAKRARRRAKRPTGSGAKRPTDDAKAWGETPPKRGANYPPPSIGGRGVVTEDLPEDESPSVGDQPSVGDPREADESSTNGHPRQQWYAATRAALRGETTDPGPEQYDVPAADYLEALAATDPPDLELEEIHAEEAAS